MKDISNNIQSYLEDGYIKSVISSYPFDAPVYHYFSHCALLISSLNCYLQGKHRVIADIGIYNKNGQLIRFATTLPDIDLSLYSDLTCLKTVQERLTLNFQSASSNYEYSKLVKQTGSGDYNIEYNLGISFITNNSFYDEVLKIVKSQLSKFWNKLNVQSLSIINSIQNWRNTTEVSWPEHIQVNSKVDQIGKKIYEEFRELFDHVYLDLQAIKSDVKKSENNSIFIIRKKRFNEENDGIRHKTNRIVSKKPYIKENYMLAYFLSWRQIDELNTYFLENGEELLAKLNGFLEHETSDIRRQLLKTFITKITKASYKEKIKLIVEGVERAQGEYSTSETIHVDRAVSDTTFQTTIPEIVWDISKDLRYKDQFREQADPVLVCMEEWILTDSIIDKTFVFIPFADGGNITFNSFVACELGFPDFSKEFMHGLQSVSNVFFQVNRTYQHYMMDSYPKLIINEFFECYLKLVSRNFFDSNPKNKITKSQFVEEINNACQIVHIVYGYPLITFNQLQANSEEQSPWSCLEKVLYDFHYRQSHFEWLESEMYVGPLKEVGYQFDPAYENKKFIQYMQNSLEKEFALYIMHQLPTQLHTLSGSFIQGRRQLQRSIRHEIGDLISFGIESKVTQNVEIDSKYLLWIANVMRDRIGDLNDYGQPDISKQLNRLKNDEHLIESELICNVKEQLSFINELPPGLGNQTFNKGKLKALVVFPKNDNVLEVKLTASMFFAIWKNLWQNSKDILNIMLADELNESSGSFGRLTTRINQAIEKYGSFTNRFSENEHPEPKMLLLIREYKNLIIIELFDNAPELARSKLSYPGKAKYGHIGTDVIQNIQDELKVRGIQCNYQRAHSFEDCADDEVEAILACLKEKTLKNFDLNNQYKWTRTKFDIEKNNYV